MRSLSVVRLSLVGLLALAAWTGASLADDDDDEKKRTELREQIVNMVLRDHQLLMQSHLLLHVEDIQRVCQLNAKDIVKLRIAAKGAAAQAAAKQRKTVTNSVRFEPGWLDVPIWVGETLIHAPHQQEDTDEPENELEKEKPVFNPSEPHVKIAILLSSSSAQFVVKQLHSSSYSGFGGTGVHQLRQHPVWVKMYKQTITPEQNAHYEKSLTKRREKLRDAAIQWNMERLSHQLRLSAEQYEKIHKIYSAIVKKNRLYATQSPDSLNYTAKAAFKQLKASQMSEILSEAQMRLWHAFNVR